MAFRLTVLLLILAAGAAACAAAPVEAGEGTEPESTTTVALTSLPPVTTSSTTTTSMTTTTTSTTIPPKPAIVLGFAGDTSFTHGVHTLDPLAGITTELSKPDAMFVNLETAVAESDVGSAVDKKYTFRSPPVTVELLKDAGVDVVQLGNNHTLDYRRPALLRTLELLDEGGIAYAGAGPDEEAAYAPLFLDVEGWSVSMVSFSRVPCDWSWQGENTRPEVAWTCDPFADKALAAVEAASSADVTVVMVHWGIEGDHCPQPYQRDLATAWVEAGADLVIGGHPHVLQGVERIGDAWLVNSTGNFAFPSARDGSARTAIFEFTIAEDADIELAVTPVWGPSARPSPAEESRAGSILSDLDRWSFGIDFDEEGNAFPSDDLGACG